MPDMVMAIALIAVFLLTLLALRHASHRNDLPARDPKADDLS